MEEIPRITFEKKSKVELDFEIFTLQSLFNRQVRILIPLDKPQRLDFYLILFVTEGSGSHFIDFKEYRFDTGCVLFVSKGQVHAFELAEDRNGFIVLFTEAFLSRNLIHSETPALLRLYNYHLHSPVMRHDEIGGVDFLSILQSMHNEYYAAENFAKEEILQLFLRILLLKAERIKRTFTPPQEANLQWFGKFDTFRKLLEKHFSETRNVNQFAEMMNISYKHLNQVCKAVSGRTAKAFVDDFVILEIKRYLAATDLSIKELTYELGFNEPTNFVKFFKRYTHQSPSQFRNALTGLVRNVSSLGRI